MSTEIPIWDHSVWTVSTREGACSQSRPPVLITRRWLTNENAACVLGQLEFYSVLLWVHFCYIVSRFVPFPLSTLVNPASINLTNTTGSLVSLFASILLIFTFTVYGRFCSVAMETRFCLDKENERSAALVTRSCTSASVSVRYGCLLPHAITVTTFLENNKHCL